jgi:hypothetical protein
MSRLEAVVRSLLSFRRNMSEGIAAYVEPAETVAITFDGRLFVWHAVEEATAPVTFGTPLTGPTLTSVLGSDTDGVVATELERLLSALTYLYDVPTEVTHYGSHWTTDPFEPPIARGPQTPGWARKEPFDWINLRRDSPAALKALGWYREGKNAGSPFYRFLAHWNALEAVFGSLRGRAEFVDRATPRLASGWTDYALPGKPSAHFYDVSRHAIAHVIRGKSDPVIDPDLDPDRRRLDWESRFIECLVPAAVQEAFGTPVVGGRL